MAGKWNSRASFILYRRKYCTAGSINEEKLAVHANLLCLKQHSCAEYVRHLVKANKEKEEAIEKVKQDLQAKRRQLQEDKAQQDPSDPESTTSDLTESSASAGASAKDVKVTSSESGDASIGNTSQKHRQKRLLVSNDSTVSSTSGEDRRLRTVVADQTSSVSDVTDSNKGSSMEGSGKDESNVDSSVFSDAAVASGSRSSKEKSRSGVVISGEKRKTRSTKAKSVNAFDVDYEEVFVKSNVPQLLATPSGRVVACKFLLLSTSDLTQYQPTSHFVFFQGMISSCA